MTTLVENLAGATFAAPNILLPSLPTVPGGATTVLWAYLGSSIGQSQNLIVGAPAMTVLGSPTFQSNYVSNLLPGATPNAIDTGLLDDQKTFTLFFVTRQTDVADAQSCVPIANVDNVTSFGVTNGITGTGNWTVATNASGINRTLAVTGVTNWKVYCISYDDTARQQTLFNLTDNTQDGPFTGTGSRNLSASGHWLIGANPRTTLGTRKCDVAMVGKINNQAINLATAQQYAANIKANLAQRGLVVA